MNWEAGLWQAALLAAAATLFVMLAGRIGQGRAYLWAIFALIAGALLAGGAALDNAGVITDARTLAMGSFIAASLMTLGANAAMDRFLLLSGADPRNAEAGRDTAQAKTRVKAA